MTTSDVFGVSRDEEADQQLTDALATIRQLEWAVEPVEWCRVCRDLELPSRPAEFIVWGKLFPAKSLGPRCAWHLDADIPISRVDQYAVFDLRGVVRFRNRGPRGG